ncbi:hypothetical protein J5N97_000465 [Dioscorea zingiberensis]|uniref:Uncharacterized protein n=1 Tax=Dioscorea zingiberensis TaxID=325984 RepID=A0A9D5H1M6_9LILI|nr:hypothetical protein J5N97_000465 [Dioscorea zingiberensis]
MGLGSERAVGVLEAFAPVKAKYPLAVLFVSDPALIYTRLLGRRFRIRRKMGLRWLPIFESDKSAGEYAKMYKEDGLTGGHVIMLGADPLSRAAAIEALHAYPGGSLAAFLLL